MKGVLYISFLVCMLLGCSDGDSLPDWKKDKTARTELEIASASIVEGNPRKNDCQPRPWEEADRDIESCVQVLLRESLQQKGDSESARLLHATV